jgi:hypothetical protein
MAALLEDFSYLNPHVSAISLAVTLSLRRVLAALSYISLTVLISGI